MSRFNGERGVEIVSVTPKEFTELLNETVIDGGIAYRIESWCFDPSDAVQLPSHAGLKRHLWIVWRGLD